MPQRTAANFNLDTSALSKDKTEVLDEIAKGGRYVRYPYCIGMGWVVFRRVTKPKFVPAHKSAFLRGLPWALVTLLFGWWGFPWGPIYSVECLVFTLGGGEDVTEDVLAQVL